MSETCAVAKQPFCDDIPTDFGYDLATLEEHGIYGERAARNGLYAISTKLLDGVHGGQTGVSVLATAECLEAARSFIILEAITVPEANGKVK